MEDLFKGRPIDIRQVMNRLKQAAAEAGLPLAERERTYNSRLAQELGKWAESEGKGDNFHKAVFHAYFAEGENIGAIPVLTRIAESLGLDRGDAQRVLETRVFKDSVDRDWAFAGEIGITAVPTMLLGERALVGAQPYHVIEAFVADRNVKRRSTVS